MPYDDRTAGVNANICVVGAPGTGKTRGVVIPNILNGRNKSFIVSDPKGQLYKNYAPILKKCGRHVMLVDFSSSNPESVKYNPFAFVRTTQDVMRFAHQLAYQKDSLCARDPFWDLCSESMLASIIDYLKFHAKEDLQTLYYIGSCIHLADRRGGEETDSMFDAEIEQIRQSAPSTFCVRQWDKVGGAPYRTYQSIITTASTKMTRLDTPEIHELTDGENELDLKKLAEEPTVLFVVVPDTDRSMDCLASLLMTQAYSELIHMADHTYPQGRLPLHTTIVLDDYATSLQLQDLDKILAASRSRNISTMIILQNEGQLKEDANVIIGSCDNYVYLGTGDVETAKNVAIKSDLDPYTVLHMPVGRSIVFRRGERPSIRQRIFQLDEHKELFEQEEKNIFSILKGKGKAKA